MDPQLLTTLGTTNNPISELMERMALNKDYPRAAVSQEHGIRNYHLLYFVVDALDDCKQELASLVELI